MKSPKYPPRRKPQDVGEVVFLFEKMNVARDLSSCCVGVEALLEANVNNHDFGWRSRNQNKPGKVD